MLPIYIINLPQRKDRLQRISKQLDSFGLSYTVFEATPNEDGRHGLRMTMKKLFETVKENQILVLEDDCHFLENPSEAIIQALNQIPKNFDLLFLGGNVYKPVVKYSDVLYKLIGCVGNHAVVYTRKVMNDMIHEYSDTKEPTDIILDRVVVRNGNSYIINPLLATQYPGYSDIEKKEVDYKYWLEDRYHKNVN